MTFNYTNIEIPSSEGLEITKSFLEPDNKKQLSEFSQNQLWLHGSSSDVSLLCACTGIRYCCFCMNTDRVLRLEPRLCKKSQCRDFQFYCYNSVLQHVVFCSELKYQSSLAEIFQASKKKYFSKHHEIETVQSYKLPGLTLFYDFISKNEEQFLINKIQSQPWTLSQSGRRKQDYGPKVNFKKQKIKVEAFCGLPDYTDLFLNRLTSSLKKANDTKNFEVFEMSNLEYLDDRQSCIDMHKDDDWIWGERLISINLLSDTVMSFQDVENKRLVFVYVPRRSMLCMADDVRYVYLHGIFSHHVNGKRLAITLREAAKDFKDGGQLFEEYGKELNRRAKIRISTE